MPASTSIATPITARQVQETGTGVAMMVAIAEKATQTFNQNTPVQVDVAGATGFVIACPAMVSVATAIIAGFSTQPGSNLTTSGVGKTLTTGQKVPNQASAVVIPVGAPWAGSDGLSYFVQADDDVVFQGTFGDSADNTLAVLAQAQITKLFGLFKDPGNSFWYVDNHVIIAATGACVEIVELIDPIGTLNGRVAFKVTKAAQQLNA
jgi:hypothetical protein